MFDCILENQISNDKHMIVMSKKPTYDVGLKIEAWSSSEAECMWQALLRFSSLYVDRSTASSQTSSESQSGMAVLSLTHMVTSGTFGSFWLSTDQMCTAGAKFSPLLSAVCQIKQLKSSEGPCRDHTLLRLSSRSPPCIKPFKSNSSTTNRSYCTKYMSDSIKGTVHQKMKILSWFTPNLFSVLLDSSEIFV